MIRANISSTLTTAPNVVIHSSFMMTYANQKRLAVLGGPKIR